MKTSPHTEVGSLLTELILETFRLNGLLLAAGNRLAAPLGQTSSRWQVLGAIENQPKTVSDIAHEMGLSRQSVQRTADHLTYQGWTEFKTNPRHRKAQLLQLTQKGTESVRALNTKQIAWANELGKDIAKDKLESGLTLLLDLRKRLELRRKFT